MTGKPRAGALLPPRPVRRRLVLAAACALALVPAQGPAVAARARKVLRADEAPAWLLEASRRATPAGATGFIVLHDECAYEVQAAGGVRETCRYAYRALSEGGVRDGEAATVVYREGDEPAAARGWLLPGDGTLHAADPKLDVSDEPLLSDETHTDARIVVVRLPGLRAGGVTGFETTKVATLDLGAEPFQFGLQAQATLFARASVRVPEGWALDHVAWHAERLKVERDATTITLTATDLAPLPVRGLPVRSADVLPGGWLRWASPDGTRGFADWNAVGRYVNELHRGVLEDAGDAPALARQLRGEGPLLDALSRAFDFAARDVRYVAIEVGIGGFRAHPPAKVLRARYGDCKDKATLLRVLAGAWGLPTAHVLVRTRDRGPVDPRVPSPGQFDHMIAGIVLPRDLTLDPSRGPWAVADVPGAGRMLFLDATNSRETAWDLPAMDQGTTALVVLPDRAELVTLPVSPPAAAATRVRSRVAVNQDGDLIEATREVVASGGAAGDARAWWAEQDQVSRERWLEQLVQDIAPGAHAVERTIEGLERVGEPVRTRVTLRGGRFGKRAGELLIVTPGQAGHTLLDTPLPEKGPDGPVEVGPARSNVLEVDIDLPAGWSPESLPARATLDGPEVRFEAEWTLEDRTLRYRRTAELKVPEVAPARWAEFRAAVRRLLAADGKGVVLVRK